MEGGGSNVPRGVSLPDNSGTPDVVPTAHEAITGPVLVAGK
jgi:hypothetical protein